MTANQHTSEFPTHINTQQHTQITHITFNKKQPGQSGQSEFLSNRGHQYISAHHAHQYISAQHTSAHISIHQYKSAHVTTHQYKPIQQTTSMNINTSECQSTHKSKYPTHINTHQKTSSAHTPHTSKRRANRNFQTNWIPKANGTHLESHHETCMNKNKTHQFTSMRISTCQYTSAHSSIHINMHNCSAPIHINTIINTYQNISTPHTHITYKSQLGHSGQSGFQTNRVIKSRATH